jgi:1-acyl-sn-glycerol-3-phosphate acyltransferase
MDTTLDASFLKDMVGFRMDADSMDNLDVRAIKPLIEPVRQFGRLYFRCEVRGIERIPEGPAMVVGNHNAGITFLEPFFMAAEYYAQRGFQDPLYMVAHDAMVAIPVLRNALLKLGAVRATRRNSEEILRRGRKMVVYPGGNHEAFRTYANRHRIDFGGHKGFARLAVDMDAPVVPVINVGGHETLFILHRGEKLSTILGVDKVLRSKACPVAISLPWGVSVGPIFHLPLPAKTEIEVGEPIRPSQVRADVPREQRADALYDVVVGTLQRMMDTIAARRRFPVLG